jgi:hypothetical protein
MGFRVEDLRCGACVRVRGSGFRVPDVKVSGCRVQSVKFEG